MPITSIIPATPSIDVGRQRPAISLLPTLRGPRGLPGASGEEVNVGTRAYAETQSIGAGVSFLRTAGYATVGDGGAALYIRAMSDPGAGGFQSADGAWWALSDVFVTPQMFGAAGDGVTDDSAALQEAVDASLAVRLPPGNYLVTTPIDLRIGSSIVGAGRDATRITVGAAIAALRRHHTVEAQGNILIADLAIEGGHAGTTGISFVLVDSTEIRSCDFIGLSVNVSIDRGRRHLIEGCTAEGNTSYKAGQLKLFSSVDDNYIFYPCVRSYYVNCGLFDAGVVTGCADPAIYTRRTIELRLDDCQVDHAERDSGADFILIENDSQGGKINGGSSHGAKTGVKFRTGSGVQVGPGYFEILNHDVDAFTVAAIDIDCSQPGVGVLISIHGGILTGARSTGLPYVRARQVIDLLVAGVHIEDYSGNNYGTAFDLDNVIGAVIANNELRNLETGFIFGATTGALRIHGNSVINAAAKTSGSFAAAGTRIANNYGLNPLALTTPSLPASGATYTNNTGVPLRIGIGAGTVSLIAINGRGTLALAGQFLLDVGETIAITYTVAPTWSFMPM
ncbi:MAG: hypothetical protein J0H94_03860 [Rhizobiales bacterium]|nr:hypothetical protein [Hyphomicrobiales bacterium]